MISIRHALLNLGLSASMLFPLYTQAQSTHMNASEKISYGTLSVITSPAASSHNNSGPAGSAFAGLFGSYMVVAGSVEAGKDVVEFTLDGISNGARISVQVSKATAEKLKVSVGTTLNLISHATGAVLVTSGNVLAFIPNTVGQALMHQEKITVNKEQQTASTKVETPTAALKPTGY